jgi:hypothetical protein
MYRFALMSALMAAGTAGAATGQPVLGGPEWLAARAAVFSDVCMASAPGFADLETRAEAAGLERIQSGWALPQEATVTLIAHDGFCSCFLTVGAPDQDAMIDAIHARLMADWGDSYTGPPDGLKSVAPFQRAGIEAVSILERRSIDGHPWLAARVSVFGACPASEAGQ